VKADFLEEKIHTSGAVSVYTFSENAIAAGIVFALPFLLKG
jgi:hypothetical protein